MVDIVINDVIPRNRYTASGGETTFDFTYPIFDADHIKVQRTTPAALNAPITLVRGIDYSVTGVNDEDGGIISLLVGAFPTGATANDIFTLTRDVPYERLNDYQFSGDFESSDINNDLDLVVMQTQQLNRLMLAGARLDDTDELTTLPIKVEAAASRIGRALTFNAAGNGLEAGPSAQDIEDAGPNATAAAASAGQALGYRNETLLYRNEAQAAAAGMKRKNPARAATTAALPTSTYANGSSGVGATLTATANGALAAQDGVTLVAGEALLVKNQASQLQNGIYLVTQVGSAGTPWILTRQVDSDTWSEIVAAVVTVMEGTTQADIDFLCTSNSGGTMGTTAITWQAYNSVIENGIVTPPKMSDMLLLVHGQCRLSLSGANLLLSQYNGKYININGTPQAIPSGGVSLAPTGAAATTVYYIYAYMSGVTMTLEFSTTGHSKHTNGIEIKTGDPTRTLVGMAYASALNTWGTGGADVASWFNRRNVSVSGEFSTARQTTSASLVELNSEIRCNFLSWGDETVSCKTNQTIQNGTAGNNVATQLNIDGSTPLAGNTYMQPVTYLPWAVGISDDTSVSEGRHYLTVFGATGGGTATWHPPALFTGASKTVATVRI